MSYLNINLDELTNDELREFTTELICKLVYLEKKLSNLEQKLICLEELLDENDIEVDCKKKNKESKC